jgi:hypothetical protein
MCLKLANAALRPGTEKTALPRLKAASGDSEHTNSSSEAVAVTVAWTRSNRCNLVRVCTHDPDRVQRLPRMDVLRYANCGLDVPSFDDKRRP